MNSLENLAIVEGDQIVTSTGHLLLRILLFASSELQAFHKFHRIEN